MLSNCEVSADQDYGTMSKVAIGPLRNAMRLWHVGDRGPLRHQSFNHFGDLELIAGLEWTAGARIDSAHRCIHLVERSGVPNPNRRLVPLRIACEARDESSFSRIGLNTPFPKFNKTDDTLKEYMQRQCHQEPGQQLNAIGHAVLSNKAFIGDIRFGHAGYETSEKADHAQYSRGASYSALAFGSWSNGPDRFRLARTEHCFERGKLQSFVNLPTQVSRSRDKHGQRPKLFKWIMPNGRFFENLAQMHISLFVQLCLSAFNSFLSHSSAYLHR